MFNKHSGLYYLCLWAASSANAHLFSDSVNNGQGNGNAPTTVGETKCTLYRIEPLMVDISNEEVTTKVCVMDSAYEEGISGISYELDESTFPYGWDKDVEWSETVMTISQASVKEDRGKHGGGVISVVPGASIKKEKKEKGLRGGRRNLSQKIGVSTLIVLYAVPPDASNHKTSVELASDIFGITTTEAQDTNNVVVQMNACSRGKLTYVPACGAGQTCEGHPAIINGILEVPITQAVTGVASRTVANWVQAEVNLLLAGTGVNIDSFTQKMVVAPGAVAWNGAAAWAELPGTLSAFDTGYSTHMGVQMHEFGHNIGLHHSGFDGAPYGDKSCLMGATSYGDDGPRVCWNAAKSWTTGWYAVDSLSVDPAVGGSFTLVGVDDWSNNIYTQGQHRVVLQILDSSLSQDFYVMYNRAKGMNDGVIQTNFAPNQVTVSTGFGTQVSWHQAGLGTPIQATNSFPRFRKANYNGGTKDLVVKVCDMTAGVQGSTADTASVLIYLDDGAGLNNGPLCPGEIACLTAADCDDGNFCTQNSCDTNTNTCIPPVDISATLCPTCGDLTFCNPNGFCENVCDDQMTCTNDYCQADVCQHDPIAGCTLPGATLEIWTGLSGDAVSDLTTSYAFNNDPNQVDIIKDSLRAPRELADNFGARLWTYLIPKVSGTYNFHVASNDSSEFWLSTDDDDANLVKIASVSGYTGYEQWNKYSSQKSRDQSLVAGQAYLLVALYKEGGGGDHLSIAWESASVPLSVIDGSEFYVEPPVACNADSECTDWHTNPCEERFCNLARGFCEIAPIVGCENGALFETWNATSGNSVDTLIADPRYPSEPSTSAVLSGVLEAPTNIGSNFGGRMQTYLMPPQTCNYTFYIASDDNGRLNLSTDSNPANTQFIASVSGWAGVRQWTKYASQKSAPIRLVKGQMYYLEALYKEGGGGDNLAVAWEWTEHNIPLEVIPVWYTALSYTALEPTTPPSSQPTSVPTTPPTDLSTSPTKTPTQFPTSSPTTNQPASSPSKAPSNGPTSSPTNQPTPVPSTAEPTSIPSKAPSNGQTSSPTNQPTPVPPTAEPTSIPSKAPSNGPMSSPTNQPMGSPTNQPTPVPSTAKPTSIPSKAPSNGPMSSPTNQPMSSPTNQPTPVPSTAEPTSIPSKAPFNGPTSSPTNQPMSSPTNLPTPVPSTAAPTKAPITSAPTNPPTPAPTFATIQKFMCQNKQQDEKTICNNGEVLIGFECEFLGAGASCGNGGKVCWIATTCTDTSGPVPPSTSAPTTSSTPPPTSAPTNTGSCIDNTLPCGGNSDCCSGTCSKGRNKVCTTAMNNLFRG